MAWPHRDRTTSLRERFPPPDEPFAGDYAERHARLLQAVFAEPALLDPFVREEPLPRGYGVGLDERVVEYPWLLAADPHGRVLDAGSVLNHAHVLDRFLPSFDALTIVTLQPEAVAFTERGVAYAYDDLRELPFRDGRFDTVVSLSTLEHVGMDNTTYGSTLARANDPGGALERAVRELLRVLAPEGALLASVPFGVHEDHGWFRQFGEKELDELCRMLEPAETAIEFFRYSRDGWRRATRREAADARYRPATAPVAKDRAAAARAVACIRVIPTTQERSE
jgi:SAM-dependent methyltransferase